MATVTSLGFNITAKWDGTGLRTAQAQLDSLKKSLSSIDGQSLRITADVDDSAARAKLESLKALITNQSVTVTVNADTAEAVSKLTALTAQLDKIAATHVTARADVNVNEGGLSTVQARLAQFGVTHETATADVNAQAGQLDAIRGRVVQFGSIHSTATADVNANAGNLDAIQARLAQFGSTHATATASVNTDAGALDLLQARLALFGASRYVAHADVDTDSAHVHLSNMNNDVAASIRGLGGLLGAAGGAGQALGGMGSAAGGAGGALGGTASAASGASSSFGGMATTIGYVIAAMAGIVAIAPIVAASVALIPVAFVGAAAMLISTNKQLSASFSTTFSNISKTILPLAMPAITALQKGLQQVNSWLKQISPAIKEAFAAAAPLIQPMFNIVEKLVTAALPGLTAAMRAMGPLFTGLGQGAQIFGGYLGQAAETLARIPGLGQAMSAIMAAAGQVLLTVAQSIAQIVAADHGQLLVLLLQALSVLIKAFTPILIAMIPIFQMWALELRLAGDVIIALETAWRAFLQLLQGSGPIWNALVIAWNATVNGLKTAWTVVSGALVVAWNATWNAIKVAAQAVWNALQIAWSAFINAMALVWTTVSGALVAAWNAVWNGLKAAAEAVWSALQVAWSAFVGALATAWTAVSGALQAAWSAVWNAMSTAAQVVWNALVVAWNAFINGLITAWTAVTGTLEAAWSAVWNFFTNTLTTWVSTALSAITGWISNTVSAFAGWASQVIATISNWVSNTVATIGQWTISTGNLIVSWVSTFISRIADWASNVWNAIKNWVSNTVATIGQWTISTGNLIVSWVSTFISRIASWASNVWNAIKSWVSNTVSTIGSWTVQTGNLVVNWVSTFISRVKSWASTVLGHFNTWKNDVVKVVQNAVSDMGKAWDKIQDAFKKPVHFVIDTVLNKGIIGAANWVIDKLGGGGNAIPKVPVPFAEGGHVKGPGTSTSDSIPALLSDGEFVLNANAVKAVGLDTLNTVNTFGHVGFASGGAVSGDSKKSDSNKYGLFGDGGPLLKIFGDIIKGGGGVAADIMKGVSSIVDAPAKAAGGVVGFIGGLFGHPHAGDSLKKSSTSESLLKAVSSAFGFLDDKLIGPIVDKVFDFISHATADKVPGLANGGAVSIIGKMAAKMYLKNLIGGGPIKKAMVSFLLHEVQQAASVVSSKVAGTKAVKAWAPTVLQALSLTGHPASWLGPILTTMAKESGGNPNAINRTDINARNGVPSQGLMQVIPPTFSAYHQPGTSNNILDPLANIAAAINYIAARYGVPTGRSPYASGTDNASTGYHLVGEQGPEMVLFGGGEQVKTASETADILGGGAPSGGTAPAQSSTGTPTGIDQQKLAADLEVWKKYLKQIQDTSSTAWTSVKTTASGSWSNMQSSAGPFASGLAKMFSDSGNSIVDSAKNTWGATRALALTTWNEEKTNGAAFTADLQKTFYDTSTNIQTKWKNDLTQTQTDTTKSWTDTKTAATQFSTDMQKTYTDMGVAVGTSWKNTLTTATTDTTKYWTDTKAQYTQGVTDMNTGLVQPVTTMMDTDLPNAFTQSVTAIGTAWTNLKTTVREPVAAVVDVVFNQGIVAMWNAIAGTFDAPTLDTFTMPGFATGGAVQGAGTGTSDSITARLSNGEHVWTAAEVAGAGGHQNVAALRSAALGGANVRQGSYGSHFAAGGAVSGGTAGTVGAPQGGTSSATAADPTATGGGDPISQAASAALGSIKGIANPFIEAAGTAGKAAIAALLPDDVPYKTMLNNMVDQMVGTVTSYITANDVAPTIGGANDAAAQAWADAQVGKPYALGGNFGVTFDCSQYMSGIARAILGETPAPWFTTFAFSGDTAPAGFERELEAPFMIGITNVGVGHTAGTLNGTNYEATPPAVRSGPSARGYNDSMFQDWYGFRPSIEAAVGTVSDSNHLAIIDAALAAAGVPPPSTLADWEDGLNTIITYESAWNPNAINNTDINAQNGIPSQGLAQVIPPTFSAYHVAGTSDNILDPIANVAAAINYIVSVYGTIGNVPGVASIRSGGGYLPYYSGTRGAQAGWHTVGERGPEWVKFRGGEEVLPNGQLPPSSGGNGDIHISVPITVQGNMDDATYRRVENELVPKIRMMLQQRRGR